MCQGNMFITNHVQAINTSKKLWAKVKELNINQSKIEKLLTISLNTIYILLIAMGSELESVELKKAPR